MEWAGEGGLEATASAEGEWDGQEAVEEDGGEDEGDGDQ